MKHVRLWLIGAVCVSAAWVVSCRRDEAPTAAPGSTASRITNAAAPQADPSWPSILIITIDTIRAGHLSCYGYFRETTPVLDALADRSVVFDHCIAPVAQTLPSHTSLFTGVYPREHGYTCNLSYIDGYFIPSDKLKVFAKVLQEKGYTTGGFVSAEPLKKVGNLDVGFDTWWEPPDTNRVEAQRTNREVFRWMDSTMKKPFFAWIHYFDPHNAYDPPPPYDTRFDPEEPALKTYIEERHIIEAKWRQGRPNPDWTATEQISLYDGEIAYTDAQIGEVFQRLRDKGVWDDLVVIVTGDHGEGLGQHGELAHNDIWNEQLRVPLIVRVPGRAPRRVATPLSTIDILPTVLGMSPAIPADAFLPQVTGRDVLRDADPDRPLYAQMPRNRRSGIAADTLIDADWKYVRGAEGLPRHLQRPTALYDLSQDPFELANVIDAYPDRAAAMDRELTRVVTEQTRRGRANRAGMINTQLTAEQRAAKAASDRALGGLGYADEDDADADEGAGEREGRDARPARGAGGPPDRAGGARNPRGPKGGGKKGGTQGGGGKKGAKGSGGKKGGAQGGGGKKGGAPGDRP